MDMDMEMEINYCPKCGNVRCRDKCKCGYRFPAIQKVTENFVKECYFCKSTKNLEWQPGTSSVYFCNECAYLQFLKKRGYDKILRSQGIPIGVEKEI